MATRPAPDKLAFDPDALPPGFEVFADEAAFEAFIKEGEDAADRGEVVSHEEVVAEFRAYISEMRAR